MDVLGVNHVSDPKDSGRIKKVQDKKYDSSQVHKNTASRDNVNISQEAKAAFKDRSIVNMVGELPEIRKEAVEKAKLQIENGTLFTDEVIKSTADKLFKALKEESI